MKTILLFLFLAMTGIAQAQQKVIQDSSGNYIASRIINPKPQATNKIYTDRAGDVYVVYRTSGGKLYILRRSKKTGKEYKVYLTPQ